MPDLLVPPHRYGVPMYDLAVVIIISVDEPVAAFFFELPQAVNNKTAINVKIGPDKV